MVYLYSKRVESHINSHLNYLPPKRYRGAIIKGKQIMQFILLNNSMLSICRSLISLVLHTPCTEKPV